MTGGKDFILTIPVAKRIGQFALQHKATLLTLLLIAVALLALKLLGLSSKLGLDKINLLGFAGIGKRGE